MKTLFKCIAAIFAFIFRLIWVVIVVLFTFIWSLIKFPFVLLGLGRAPVSGHEYEYMVAKYLRKHGYHGVSVTKASGDFGADVIAKKGFKKYAVQCKYYSSPVGVAAVQEVTAAKAHYGCNAAMVVTNSTFTPAARKLAEENNVKLMSGISGSR